MGDRAASARASIDIVVLRVISAPSAVADKPGVSHATRPCPRRRDLGHIPGAPSHTTPAAGTASTRPLRRMAASNCSAALRFVDESDGTQARARSRTAGAVSRQVSTTLRRSTRRANRSSPSSRPRSTSRTTTSAAPAAPFPAPRGISCHAGEPKAGRLAAIRQANPFRTEALLSTSSTCRVWKSYRMTHCGQGRMEPSGAWHQCGRRPVPHAAWKSLPRD